MQNIISFLFWNIQNKDVSNELTHIVKTNNIDIVILAECKDDVKNNFLISLQRNNANFIENTPIVDINDIKFFSKYPNNVVTAVQEHERMVIKEIMISTIPNFFIIGLHLHSSVHRKRSGIVTEVTQCIEQIKNLKKPNDKYNKTVIIGDFNLDPYDEQMTAHYGFNSIMSRKKVRKQTRSLNKIEYDLYYNPMWNLFGDHHLPCGSYYHKQTENEYWHILDQVIISYSLIDNFDVDSLRIIDNDNGMSLVNKNGIPDRNQYSDHLPITFKMQF